MDAIAKLLTPDSLVVAVALILFLALLVPIALRLAGLSGSQIEEVWTETLRFFLALVDELRNQNKPTS